jgi:hypothetical protein
MQDYTLPYQAAYSVSHYYEFRVSYLLTCLFLTCGRYFIWQLALTATHTHVAVNVAFLHSVFKEGAGTSVGSQTNVTSRSLLHVEGL